MRWCRNLLCRRSLAHRGPAALYCEDCAAVRRGHMNGRGQKRRRRGEVLIRRCIHCGSDIAALHHIAKQCLVCAEKRDSQAKVGSVRRARAEGRIDVKKQREYRKRWNKRHPERVRAEKSLYRARHRDHISERDRRYRQNNPEKQRTKKLKERGRLKNARVGRMPPYAVRLRALEQGNLCLGCGREFGSRRPPTRDHVVALSQGGPHDFANIVALCRSCNSSKGAKSLPEWVRTRRG